MRLPGQLNQRIKRLPLLFSLLALAIFIYDFGIQSTALKPGILFHLYQGLLLLIGLSYILRYVVLFPTSQRRGVWIFDSVLVFFSLGSFFVNLLKPEGGFPGSPVLTFFLLPVWYRLFFFIVFLRELALIKLKLKQQYFNPALLFILSFVAIILLGTLLLLLPNATYGRLSLLDAFFTSTSAVCVTGLMVVDFPGFFTPVGQMIVLVLIQIGGLGIMTFTSFFAYFFQDTSSFKSQLMVQDITNTEKAAEVFRTLKKVVALTFGIEGVGAVLIFLSVKGSLFATTGDRVFFAIFHSVSGFCNAGMSILPTGLYDPAFRFNYLFLMIVAFLFIIGGIGFPIVFNYIRYLKHGLKNRWAKYNRLKFFTYLPGIININTKIVIYTTAILIAVGTVSFFIFEFGNTLAEHSLPGKIIVAFFTATVPRTAGFYYIDMNAMHFSTMMIFLFLMWVGGSPASTAGGIKTSTLALATLNILSISRGSRRVEAFRREISEYSIRRAFATIALSLIVIGLSVFLIAMFDSDMDLLHIAFESFAAYSTAGLSLGITADLSAPSKVVVMLTMFVGRVSMLTIMVAFFRKVKDLRYQYPSEEILIN